MFDRVVKTVVPSVYCITEREASNLGIFLRAIMVPLIRWTENRKIYEKEAQALPGFAIRAFEKDGGKKAEFFQYVPLSACPLLRAVTLRYV